MGNLVKIQTVTVPSGGQSTIQFSSIPSTYQDIFIVMTARTNRASAVDGVRVYFNTDTTTSNYHILRYFNATTTVSAHLYNTYNEEFGYISGNNATASNFGSSYFFIPNYSNTTLSKQINVRSGGTDNSSNNARSTLGDMTWTGTAAINQITLAPVTGTLFNEHTTATLYGISRQSSGATGSKATGGTVVTSGGYTYHTFTSTGEFVPTASITGGEVLIVAGGGGAGGGSWASGGGGAGGLVYASGQTFTSGTKYPVIVGAGGAGADGTEYGKNGSNSMFGALTVAVGGGGGGGYTDGGATNAAAQVGGSGGGGSSGQGYGGTSSGAAGTAGQGNSGGGGRNNPNMTGGGGGGAGATGGTASTTAAGNGGNGVNTYSAWASATGTGKAGYYAGGGGGSSGGLAFSSSVGGTGGLGGGGQGVGHYAGYGSNATPLTGGGGGAQAFSDIMGSGGSGVVIVRYTT